MHWLIQKDTRNPNCSRGREEAYTAACSWFYRQLLPLWSFVRKISKSKEGKNMWCRECQRPTNNKSKSVVSAFTHWKPYLSFSSIHQSNHNNNNVWFTVILNRWDAHQPPAVWKLLVLSEKRCSRCCHSGRNLLAQSPTLKLRHSFPVFLPASNMSSFRLLPLYLHKNRTSTEVVLYQMTSILRHL